MRIKSRLNPTSNDTTSIYLEAQVLKISGSLNINSVDDLLESYNLVLHKYDGKVLEIHLDELIEADDIGITSLKYLLTKLSNKGIHLEITGANQQIQRQLELYTGDPEIERTQVEKPGYFEELGRKLTILFNDHLVAYLHLAAEITYWSFITMFIRRAHRRGEVVNQAVLMGVNAAFIVGTMSFIIGLVLALQSAAQLRSFGANIYIVDLTVIAMMSEMGPLITAIMVAGRSGSSIAAEIATMKVTSETDALKTMGMNPVRFVIVPKMYAGFLTMPFLTILADLMGILGGLLIASSYLDISPVVFINRMQESLLLKDIITGILKSLVFSYLIVLTGSYYGFRVQKGAAGVGKVTTNAVVVAISMVIVADSIIGLLIY